MMKRFPLLLICMIGSSVNMLLFSYTQVDLSLTLSRQGILRDIQTFFQTVGFYQRPSATLWFIFSVCMLLALLVFILFSVKQKKISVKQLFILFGIQSCILFFSYPAAFSYDIFNYIFTSKTVLLYNVNPYTVTPLSFQGIDPMLSFMRWTHLPSAYTPFWILLTLPFFIISGNIFIFSLFTLKIISFTAYLVSIFLIYNILHKEFANKQYVLTGTILFAGNPLILIESLISGHNDIVMMMFALFAYWFVLKKLSMYGFFFWALSVAAKLMTFPLGILFLTPWKKGLSVLLLCAALCLVLLKREFLPWYAVWIIPFAVLLPDKKILQFGILGLSIGLLLRYAPVLYTGGYQYPVRIIQDGSVVICTVLAIAFGLLFDLVKKRKASIISV